MASSMPSVMIKEKLIFKFVNTFVENTIVPVKTMLGENSKKHLINNFFSLSSDCEKYFLAHCMLIEVR